MAAPAAQAETVVIRLGEREVGGWSEAAVAGALVDGGFPGLARLTDDKGAVTYVTKHADKERIDWGMTLLILFVMVLYVTMVYGPIAAFLVELFPTRIRYTSMSLPYHIGNGWCGGVLPLLATAMVAATGDIYYGLWYPVVVAGMTLVIGTLFLRETRARSIHQD